MYTLCADVLREMVLTYQSECVHTIVPVLTQVHLAFQESNIPGKYHTLNRLRNQRFTWIPRQNVYWYIVFQHLVNISEIHVQVTCNDNSQC